MKLLHFIELIDEDLRFDRRSDWKAAQIAEMLSSSREDYTEELIGLINGKEVAIVFPSSRMPSEEELRPSETIIAVDGATNWFAENGLEPDIVVTDLDGITVFPKRPIYVVLLHGDNLQYLHKISEMEKVIFSVQVFPRGKPIFTGGFTDGDRALALAMKYGAKSIRLLNFDTSEIGKFSKPPNYPLIVKKKLAKLRWAERIIDFLKSC